MKTGANVIKGGMIILWYGAIADIPGGWTLCDGTLNTPNLQDVFVVGAGSTYVVNAVGGGISHNHSFDGDGHTHPASGNVFASGTDGGVAVGETGLSTGTTDSANGLPPYRALAYIMKL